MNDNDLTVKKTQQSETNERNSLIVLNRVRSYLKDQGCSLSAEAVQELHSQIFQLLDRAVIRTRSNHRTIIRPHDF